MSTGEPRPRFYIGETLSASWHVFTAHFGVIFLGHLVINTLLSCAFTMPPFLWGFLLMGPLCYGLCHITLAAQRGEPVRLEDVFSGFHRFAPALFTGLGMLAIALGGLLIVAVPAILAAYLAWNTHSSAAFSLACGVGGALCLVPLCAAVVLYLPAFFFIHDDNMDARTAMTASRRMVMGNLGQWLNLWAGLSLLHLGGLALCCVGLFVATPWMFVALALAYDRERGVLRSQTPPAGPEE